MSLLCLRTTPVYHKLPSPAELLLGHPIQDNLPRKISWDPSSEDVISRLIERQHLQKHYYDRSAKSLLELAPGQRITIQDPESLTWKPAEVKERLVGTPRSYAVTSATGRELRRNRAHIREAHQENRAVSAPSRDPIVMSNRLAEDFFSQGQSLENSRDCLERKMISLLSALMGL